MSAVVMNFDLGLIPGRIAFASRVAAAYLRVHRARVCDHPRCLQIIFLKVALTVLLAGLL